MSHFRFPRPAGPIEEDMINSVVHSIEPNDITTTIHRNTDSATAHDDNNSNGDVSTTDDDSSGSSTILAPTKQQRRRSQQQNNPTQEERRCWICFGDSSDSQGKWVKPCQCSLEAHESCLLDWIAELQKAAPSKKVSCPQCNAPYELAQHRSLLLSCLTAIDSLVRTSTPYITVVGLGCSLLVTCTTYGAFSVLTLFGTRDGENLIGNPSTWTFKTWIGLPLIPVILISSKTRYGDAILPVASMSLLRATGITPDSIRFTWPMSPALTIGVMPWIRLFYKNAYRLIQRYMTKNLSIRETTSLPSSTTNANTSTTSSNRQRRRESVNTVNNTTSLSDRERNLEMDMINGRETTNVGMALVGALLWPAISSSVGGLLYRFKWVRHNFPDPFQRNILGGCLFVVMKDIGNLLYRYERIKQYRSRRVKNFDETS